MGMEQENIKEFQEQNFDYLFNRYLSNVYKKLLTKWHRTLTPEHSVDNMTEESRKAYNDIGEYCEFIEKYFGFSNWKDL